MTQTIATDLLTPLAAYLRLRESGRGSFLLESVERGRLGRYSFVGGGSRLCYVNEAEAIGVPVVGYVGYDHVARLEPVVRLPQAGPRLPESRFVVAETLIRFDHALGIAEVLAGDGAVLEEPARRLERRTLDSAPTLRIPDRETYENAVRRAQAEIEAGE